MMLDTNQVTKKVFDFQKNSLFRWYDVLTTLQKQTASTMDIMLGQTIWIPEHGRHAVLNWINACQKEHKRLKSYLEDGYVTIEKQFDIKKTAPEKAKKTAPEKKLRKAKVIKTKKAAPAQSKITAPLETKRPAPVGPKITAPLETKRPAPVGPKITAPLETKKP
ncbi:MAG: hypothetical protein GY874_00670 [Desulfobacteraceae bacterium]|nr:hypothetical protein [Desulfobacteraceae bacterium]